MIVYHGTTTIIEKPEIIRNEIGRDFGFAFYTTNIREQAKRWAIRKAKIASRLSEEKVTAIVNEYEWDDTIHLDI